MKKDRSYTRRQFLFSGSGPFSALFGRSSWNPDDREIREIRRAMEALVAGIAEAEADAHRPLFHYRPPARWMGDPIGGVFLNGSYHVFFQHNPFENVQGRTHWGHACSRDLVHWEHRPIALAPLREAGETHCFSGVAALDLNGRPVIWYTSVSKNGPRGDTIRPNQQWAAAGSPDLETWSRVPGAALRIGEPGMPRFDDDWRDPSLFHAGGKTYLLLAALLEGEAVVPLFEAVDGSLHDWKYRGILHRAPIDRIPYFERPHLAPIGDRWLLVYSPYRNPEYAIGQFDAASARFIPESHGKIDHGGGEGAGFYAPTVLRDRLGRRIVLGRIRGFKSPIGWDGCMSLPRHLVIDPSGALLQQPLPELRRLRGPYHGAAGLRVKESAQRLEKVDTSTVEIVTEVHGAAGGFSGLRIRDQDGDGGIGIAYDGTSLVVDRQIIPYTRPDPERPLRLHVFADRSVLEVFVDDGFLVVTKVVDPRPQGTALDVFSETEAFFSRLDVWQIHPIWKPDLTPAA